MIKVNETRGVYIIPASDLVEISLIRECRWCFSACIPYCEKVLGTLSYYALHNTIFMGPKFSMQHETK